MFTYQVDCVKHLDFSYRSAARVRQITVIIADRKGAQSWRDVCTNRNHTEETQISFFNIVTKYL